MSRGLEVRINPELLVWARETRGYMASEAAEKLKVPLEQLEKWENGVEYPTLGKLRRAAEVYKRPTAIFYLPEPPETPPAPHDFRGFDEAPGKYPPALLLEIRKARHRREIALELLDQLDEDPTPFELRATTRDDPDAVAAGIRDMLGISIEDQFAWRDEYQALRSWRSAVEELGILVFHSSINRWHKIEVAKMRGLSIVEEKLPIILINSSDRPNGRIFTLMHELVHLLLHNGGVCNLRDRDYDRPASNEKRVEVFCNRVSGTVLVPAHHLLDQKIALEKEGEVWTDAELGKLSRRFRVSREVILRRLLILGRTTQRFYEEKRKQYLEEYSKPKSKGGAVPYYRVGLRNNGIAYTRLVFRAYYDEYITTADVSDYLGIKVKHLKDMEQEVMRGI